MLDPLGLTRSNEAATRETCRGNNEPRRRAKALHTPPYSSSHQTQPPLRRKTISHGGRVRLASVLAADASASSTLFASQLQPARHRATGQRVARRRSAPCSSDAEELTRAGRRPGGERSVSPVAPALRSAANRALPSMWSSQAVTALTIPAIEQGAEHGAEQDVVRKLRH